MKIKMLRTKFVLTNGRNMEKWEKDSEYLARDSVGCRLITQGHAIYSGE